MRFELRPGLYDAERELQRLRPRHPRRSKGARSAHHDELVDDLRPVFTASRAPMPPGLRRPAPPAARPQPAPPTVPEVAGPVTSQTSVRNRLVSTRTCERKISHACRGNTSGRTLDCSLTKCR